MAIIYLIVGAVSISLTVNRPMVDFGPSDPANKGITGMQECNMSGARSLSILSIIVSFLGMGIYVRTLYPSLLLVFQTTDEQSQHVLGW